LDKFIFEEICNIYNNYHNLKVNKNLLKKKKEVVDIDPDKANEEIKANIVYLNANSSKENNENEIIYSFKGKLNLLAT